MSEYLLDTDLIARFVFTLLPHKPPYRLALDRTNRKFGTSDINVLVLVIPILYTMMPKFGNASTAERIELMQRCIDLFGIDTIDCLLAAREFVGGHWLEYLNNRRIRYHIRIRENFLIDIPGNGHRVKASWFFNHLQIIASFNKPNEGNSCYKERWQIETEFRALRKQAVLILKTRI